MDSSRQPCKYFQQGACKYGSDCMYSHDPLVNRQQQQAMPPPDSRPGRIGYRPKYPNMTLENTPKGPVSSVLPRLDTRPGHDSRLSDTRHSISRPGQDTRPGQDARPGRKGYKPKYETSTRGRSPPARTPLHDTRSSAIQKTGPSKSAKRNAEKKIKKALQKDFLDAASANVPVFKATVTGEKNQQQNQQPLTPEQVIQHDLTSVRPQWPFTSYGLTTDWSVAGNIIEGVDYSPEELRLQALCEWKATGNIAQYLADVQALKRYLDQKRENILYNPSVAIADAVLRRTSAGTSVGAGTGHAGSSVINPGLNITNPVPISNPTLSASNIAHGTHAMSDDRIDSFQLGHIPLEPPTM